jgi:hypothetical protein
MNNNQNVGVWVGSGVLRQFQQYFSYIVSITFIGGENHRPTVSHWQTLSQHVVSSTPRLSGIRTRNVSGDCIVSHKSNYHMITTTTIKMLFNETNK